MPDYTKTPPAVPFMSIFHEFGANILRGFAYNHGINFLLAGLGTWLMIRAGIDWEWSAIASGSKLLAFSGTPFGALGFILPFALPLGLYIHGRRAGKAGCQIAGLAAGQAAMLGMLVSSLIKIFTGRRDPEIMKGIILGDRGLSDFSGDFAFGFMERGIFSGWPSSHTTVVFAMLVALAGMHPKKTTLKTAAYSYAACTGVAMSLFAHWASDSVAGALIGYALGKSVAGSFTALPDKYPGPNEHVRDNTSKHHE
jgi:membrane-associated phospholipid phosphatase